MKYAHVVSEFCLGWIFRTFPQVSASGPQWSPLADADAALACFSSLYSKLTLMDPMCKSQILNFAPFALQPGIENEARYATSIHYLYMRVEQKVHERGFLCVSLWVCNEQSRLKFFLKWRNNFFLAKVLAKVHNVDMSKFAL